MRDPMAYYEAEQAAAAAEAEALDRRVRRSGRVRVLTFLVAVVPLLLLETSPRSVWPGLIGAGIVGLGLFLWLVRRHGRLSRDLRRARLRETMHREGQARIRRDWKGLPAAPIATAASEHPCASDLDLAGHASLSQLVGRVWTAPGRRVLEQVLLDPFAPLPGDGAGLQARLGGVGAEVTPRPGRSWRAELGARQEAVKALADQASFRESLELAAREGGAPGDFRALGRALEWLEQPLWTPTHRKAVLLARFLGVFTPVTTVTWFFGWSHGALPVLGALAALALHRSVAREADDRLSAAESGDGDLSVWAAQFRLAEDMPDSAERLNELRVALRSPGDGAAAALTRLTRICDTAAIRRSSLFHFPLVVFFAWDIHMLDWVERWHSRHAAAAGRWLAALGEVEVLSALAGLAHDHPDWCFPEVAAPEKGAAEGIRGAALGHPLLAPAVCVSNDVEVPPPGQLVLVTGSNMAGKTTLLRALGVNQVLALAGGPVAAKSLRTPAILPWCAMRVWDSLEGGVSYFLAELRRLKRVVDAAEAGPTLFLLDEILQGTNSAERRTAARIVLARLLDTGSIGAVTTHDLSLGDSDRLREAGVDVHFREEVRQVNGKRTLDFDYRLRPGPATSRNALLLLEMVGLGSEAPTAR